MTPFQVGNAFNLFESGNMVFPTMANSSDVGFGAVFDWGLPFFYGKDVFVGIEGKKRADRGRGRGQRIILGLLSLSRPPLDQANE